MKKKCLFTAVLLAVLTLMTPLTAMAEVKDTIEFRGEAEKFVTKIAGDEFTGIVPGETRTLSLTLENSSTSSMRFYMSAAILDNIAASGDRQAVYSFQIAKNGTVFFNTVIGDGQKNISAGQEYLSADNNILLDELKKGKSDEITIVLSLDGDSAKNTYMNQTGEIGLTFSAEVPSQPGTVVKRQVNYVRGAARNVVQSVKTGDVFPVAFVAMMIGSFLLILFLLAKKRKQAGRDGR